MARLNAILEQGRIVVRENGNLFGSIVFEPQSKAATIFVDDKKFSVLEGDEYKDMVLRYNGTALFRFKFDYLWGNASIYVEGEDTNFDIKGKWFKNGTRFTDSQDNDIVVVTSGEDTSLDASIEVNSEEGTPLMVMATLYYHIYASAGKLRMVTMAAATNS